MLGLNVLSGPAGPSASIVVLVVYYYLVYGFGINLEPD